MTGRLATDVSFTGSDPLLLCQGTLLVFTSPDPARPTMIDRHVIATYGDAYHRLLRGMNPSPGSIVQINSSAVDVTGDGLKGILFVVDDPQKPLSELLHAALCAADRTPVETLVIPHLRDLRPTEEMAYALDPEYRAELITIGETLAHFVVLNPHLPDIDVTMGIDLTAGINNGYDDCNVIQHAYQIKLDELQNPAPQAD